MSRSALRLAALVAVAAVLPRGASAQIHLGGLAKTAAKVVTTHFDSIVLELTPARIDAAIKAFSTEQSAGSQLGSTYQQREAAYQEALRQWTARDSGRKADAASYNVCMGGSAGASIGGGASYSAGGATTVAPGSGSVTVSGTGPTMSANLNDPAVRARINDLKARLQAAGKAQDMALSLALADSLRQALGYNPGSQTVSWNGTPGAATTTGAGAGVSASASLPQMQAKCGYAKIQADAQAGTTDAPPQAPAAIHDSVATLAARAGGFTNAQYAMMRERILGFLSIDFDKINNGATGYSFSPKEAVALQSKRPQLTAFQQMLATQ